MSYMCINTRVKHPLFNPGARRSTVSLTLNSDLYAKARQAGINVSRVAEQSLAEAYAAHRTTLLRRELEQDRKAIDEYTRNAGSFADFVRAHYEKPDEPV